MYDKRFMRYRGTSCLAKGTSFLVRLSVRPSVRGGVPLGGPPCSRPRLSRWQSYGLFYPPAVPAFSHQVALRHGRLRGPEPDVWVPVPSRTVTPSPSYGFLCALQYRGAATRPRCHVCPGPVTHGGGPHGQSPEFPMKVPLLFLGPFGAP